MINPEEDAEDAEDAEYLEKTLQKNKNGCGRKKKKPKVLKVSSFPEREDGTEERNLELNTKT